MSKLGKLRIIGGKYRGTVLQRPSEETTRPTANRIREALFNILSHKFALNWEETTVLDAFAGSGALSFEALSRGATHAYLCEVDSHAQQVIRWNMDHIHVRNQITLFPHTAQQLPVASHPVRLLLVDPPYTMPLSIDFFSDLHQKHWVCDRTLIVWEQDLRAPPLTETFHIEDTRAYAKTRLDFMRLKNS